MNGWTVVFAWASGLNLGVFLCDFNPISLILSLLMLVMTALDWEAESRE